MSAVRTGRPPPGDFWRRDAKAAIGPDALLQRIGGPMLATPVATSGTFGAGWVFEKKEHGYRALVAISRGKVAFRSRKGTDLAKLVHSLPALKTALESSPHSVVIDGELVALGPGGSTDFHGLRKSPRLRLVAFDLLWCDGEDLRGRPLKERRRRLETLIAELDLPVLSVVERFPGPASAALQRARRLGAEGIVAKRETSPYRPNRSPDWIKVRLEKIDPARFDRFDPKTLRSSPDSLSLSRPDAMPFPNARVTRAHLAAYFEGVATFMTPLLADRPTRVEGPLAQPARSERPRTPSVASANMGLDAGVDLLALIERGGVGLHVSSSRRGTPRHADWIAFHLAIGEDGSFARLAAVAQALRVILQDPFELRSFPKTSGTHGLDVWVPIRPPATREAAQAFVRTIVSSIVRHSVLNVVSKEAATGEQVRITAPEVTSKDLPLAPYSPCATSGTPVSTPLRWDEVNGRLRPSTFTLRKVLERLLSGDDPFAGFLEVSQALPRLTAR